MNTSRVALLLLVAACRPAASDRGLASQGPRRLPTGRWLDPAGTTSPVGQMPLGMVASPGGRRLVLLLGGWREHGLQVVDRDGHVTQTLPQAAAFVELAFSLDGSVLYASGGNTDVVYRYRWADDRATLADSIVLAPRAPRADGTHYPAGLALSLDGRSLYVAENLADSLAVVEVATGRVVQRLATGRYPYGVAVGSDGAVFVSNWGASTLSLFVPAPDGRLEPAIPRLTALRDRVAARPRIAAYLRSKRRPPFNEMGIFRRYPELDAAAPRRSAERARQSTRSRS